MVEVEEVEDELEDEDGGDGMNEGRDGIEEEEMMMRLKLMDGM